MIFNLVYHQNADLAQLLSSLEALGFEVKELFSSLRVITVSGGSAEDLAALDGVVAVDEDSSVFANPAAEYWHKLRVVSRKLPMSNTYFAKNHGAGTTVYLVDSGITISDELSSASIINLYTYNSSFDDEIDHGTGVASLIVGKTLGISPEASVKNVKIPMNVSMSVSSLLAAFDAIAADHAATPGVKIVNCSWVVAKNQILDMKIGELQSAGLIVVAAAGNTSQAADNFSPVGLDTVIGVCASDAYDRVTMWGGAGSNWGPEVDITAPGIDVDVLSNSGEIRINSGTSLAAAVVSGIAAQYVVDNPGMDARTLQELILISGTPGELFRNEILYGTTPNVLVRSPILENLFVGTPTLVDAKKNETTQFTLVANSIVGEINFDDVVIKGVHFPKQPWINFDPITKVVTLTPSNDVPTAKYAIHASVKSLDGTLIQYLGISINVFNETVAEINPNEYYYTYMKDDQILVIPSACATADCSVDDCNSTVDPKFPADQCNCVGTSCFVELQA